MSTHGRHPAWWMGCCVGLFLVSGTVVAADHLQDPDTVALNNMGVSAAQEGRWSTAAAYLRQAAALAPEDAQIRRSLSAVLTDWAVQVMQSGDVDEAAALLTEAADRDAENGQAWLRLGDLQYVERHDFPAAIQAWRRARGHLSAEQERVLADRLQRVERDAAIERGWPTYETAHSYIRVQGSTDAAMARTVGDLLEAAYQRLVPLTPSAPAKVSVIVYTDRTFARVSGGRDGALGLYDGRLRIRGDEVATDRAAALVTHELAHAFLRQAYGAHLPTWIHEGFAQAVEPDYATGSRERTLRDDAAHQRQWIPLAWLDRHFQQPTNAEDLWRAYAEARVVVAWLLKRYGAVPFTAFLQQLAQGRPVEAAFDQQFAPARWSRVNHGIWDGGGGS